MPDREEPRYMDWFYEYTAIEPDPNPIDPVPDAEGEERVMRSGYARMDNQYTYAPDTEEQREQRSRTGAKPVAWPTPKGPKPAPPAADSKGGICGRCDNWRPFAYGEPKPSVVTGYCTIHAHLTSSSHTCDEFIAQNTHNRWNADSTLVDSGELTVREMQRRAWEHAEKAGFHDPALNLLELIALIHTEASEAIEEYRNGNGMDAVAEEFADIVIRCADAAGLLGFDLESVVAAKMLKNKRRGYRHGNKLA